ncbi:Sucrose synthase [Marssonina coronariae]|uniref:Sucrose synthase n=1 Tax=Diplocarpon coronariae TaxID=2795749 RepID=A0A218ZGX4_9HELO|nr:Sucrose synthase [Marssonina coronariae]
MASPLLVLDVTAPRHHLPGASAICQSSRPSTYIMPPSPRSRGRDRHRSSEIAADTSWLDLVVMLGVLGYQPGWIRARDGVDMERRRENLRHRHSRPVGVGLCPPSPPASLLSPLCILLWPWEHVAELWLLLVSHVTALCHNNPVPEDRGHDATALSQL